MTEQQNHTLTMRPHHFDLEEVGSALKRKGSATLLAARLTATLLTGEITINRSIRGYYQDIWGKGVSHIWRRFQAYRSYLTQLKALGNEDLVKFDIQPDAICNSCAVGKHCRSTNYRVSPDHSILPPLRLDVPEEERNAATEITHKLFAHGYQSGIDYWYGETSTVVLMDMAGRPLDFPIQGFPRKVAFDPLFVKAGALRGIV